MLEDHPLFSINIKFWKFVGIISFKTYWECGAFLVFPILTNIFQVLFLVKNWGNVEALILSCFMTAILFNSIIRIVWVVLNQEDYMVFMDEIVAWFRETEERNEAFGLKVLRGVVSKADKVSKFTLFLGVLTGSARAFSALVLEGELPYPIWVPGIDVSESPYYEIIFLVQVSLVCPFIIAGYGFSTNLFITWLLFGIGTLHILQNKFETLMEAPKSAEQIEEDLHHCIQYHNKIIRYGDSLNAMLSFTNLVEFLLFTVMLCILLFLILIVDSFMLQVNAFIYITCIFYVVLLYYWFANELSCESLKIAESAYNTDWTNGNRKLKKSILIIISRSQNALEMSVGGISPMTLQAFQSILNASYSYFTILREMQH